MDKLLFTCTFTESAFSVIREEELGILGKQRIKNEGIYILSNSKIVMTSDKGERRNYSFSLNGNRLIMNGLVYTKRDEKANEKIYFPDFKEIEPDTIWSRKD